MNAGSVARPRATAMACSFVRRSELEIWRLPSARSRARILTSAMLDPAIPCPRARLGVASAATPRARNSRAKRSRKQLSWTGRGLNRVRSSPSACTVR